MTDEVVLVGLDEDPPDWANEDTEDKKEDVPEDEDDDGTA